MLKRKRSERVDTPSDRTAELHHKNPYKYKPPNFADLASRHLDLLKTYVTVNPTSGKGRIDFTDPAAARALTQAMLLNDFGVSVDIPADHLCPPLPNRINYLCWLSDLLDSVTSHTTTIDGSSTAGVTNSTCGAPNPHTVLDIGVGPVCIYPLLGHALFKWNFVGTDIDASSVQHSQLNLARNEEASKHIEVYHVDDCCQLQSRIVDSHVPKVQATETSVTQSTSLLDVCTSATGDSAALRGPILQAHASREASSSSGRRAVDSNIYNNDSAQVLFSAVMTNPPFYDTDEQIQPSEYTVCSGSTSEMRTLGGEVAFVAAIIADSLVLRNRVIWYTSMVGKHSSLKQIKRILLHEGVHKDHIFTTTLAQGLTHRWAVAWTFHSAVADAYRLSCDGKQSGGNSHTAAGTAGTDTGVHSGSGSPYLSTNTVADYVYASTVSMQGLLNTMLPEDGIILTSKPYAEHVLPLRTLCETCTISSDALVLKAVSRVLSAVHHSCTVSVTPTTHVADLQYVLDSIHTSTDSSPISATVTYSVHSNSNGGSSGEGPTAMEGTVSYSIGTDSGAFSAEGESTVTVTTRSNALPGHHSTLSKEHCNKQHELFESNLLRTNRKWRRALQQQHPSVLTTDNI